MKIKLLMALVVLMAAACSQLPDLKPLPADCVHTWPRMFPEKPRSFVHSIRAGFPHNSHATFIGITKIDPQSRNIRCNILTVEGMLLFDAVLHGSELTIHRQTPPFDSERFAAGLMQDIALVFFSPQGDVVARGTARQDRIRRIQVSEREFVDLILPAEDRKWNIRKYEQKKLVRSISAELGSEGPWPSAYQPPKHLKLKASGEDIDYTLHMELLESEILNQDLDL